MHVEAAAGPLLSFGLGGSGVWWLRGFGGG